MMVPAVERYVITIEDGGQGRPTLPRQLDVCEAHEVPVADLRALLFKAGAVVPEDGEPEPDPAKEGGAPRVRCPACGKTMVRSSVVTHLVQMHGASRVKQPRKCPDCGNTFPALRVMVSHRRAAHGYDYFADVATTIPTHKRP